MVSQNGRRRGQQFLSNLHRQDLAAVESQENVFCTVAEVSGDYVSVTVTGAPTAGRLIARSTGPTPAVGDRGILLSVGGSEVFVPLNKPYPAPREVPPQLSTLDTRQNTVLVQYGTNPGEYRWSARGVPNAGTAGQRLVKLSDVWWDVGWGNDPVDYLRYFETLTGGFDTLTNTTSISAMVTYMSVAWTVPKTARYHIQHDVSAIMDRNVNSGGIMIAAYVYVNAGADIVFTSREFVASAEVDLLVQTTMRAIAKTSVDLTAGQSIRFALSYRGSGTSGTTYIRNGQVSSIITERG